MKKAFLILGAFFLMSTFCFAQSSQEIAEETDGQAVDLKVFTGKVGLVYLGDYYEDDLRRIEVVDDIGQRLVFIVNKAKTEISDKRGEKIGLGKINKGDKVTIEYSEDKKNHKVVQTIQVEE